MGLFDKFKSGLQKTHQKLVHEMTRIVTRSPRLTGSSLEELHGALIAADLGVVMSEEILAAVRRAYETQGSGGLDVFAVAADQVEQSLLPLDGTLKKEPGRVTVVSIVGVNGTGKTTTGAKLANLIQKDGGTALLAACDTFRAAAIEQIKLWGQRLNVPVIAGAYGADPSAVGP
jgi:fused signal recognition particle receptor